MNELEKEFKIKMSIAYNESKKWGLPYSQGMNDILAKAAASLCRKKQSEAWDEALVKAKNAFLNGDNGCMYFSDAIELTKETNPYL